MPSKIVKRFYQKNQSLFPNYALGLIIFCSLLIITPLFGQKYTFHIDNNGKYNIERNLDSSKIGIANLRTAVVSISVAADSRRPATNAFATVTFGPDVNFGEISFFYLRITASKEAYASVNSLYVTKKAIDMAARKMELPIGGLQENTHYYFDLIIFRGCGGNDAGKAEYTTPKASNISSKVLLIIDKEFFGDQQIDDALKVYKRDITENESNLIFESFYLPADDSEKGKLYQKIKALYYDSKTPLKYLFFIGKNASVSTVVEDLDQNTNVVSATYSGYSVGMYAQIAAPDYLFDSNRNIFLKRRYNLCAGNQTIPNDVTQSIASSSMFDISYGALVPPREEEARKNILGYFEKLHKFKMGKLVFEKKVLLADTQFYDGSLPDKIEKLSSRWKNNDTINVPRKFGPNYHGGDAIWQADYLKKLNKNSYEIMTYMGHGSPTFHYFGIGYNEVNKLDNLNTLLLDFTSCSVGEVKTRNYLAGVYLEKGNALIAVAYSTTMLVATSGNVSPIVNFKFEKTRALQLFSAGLRVSDAYRYGNDVNSSQYLLGDPLLTLDPPCLQKIPLSLVSAGPLDLCPGESVLLTASESFNDYHWFRDGVAMENTTNSLKVTQNGVYSVSAKRCDSEYVGLQSVTVNEKVKTTFPSLTLDTFPDHFELHVKPSGIYSDFSWYINGVKFKETNEDKIVPHELADYSVEISQNGCKLLSPPVPVRIEVPVLTITGQNPACDGDNVVVVAPANYSGYEWFIDDKEPFVSISNKQNIQADTRIAVSTLRGNLKGPVSEFRSLVFNPKPVKPMVTITASGFKSSSPVNNQWYMNGSAISGSQNALLENTGGGSYFVRVTENGCYSDSDPIVITAGEPTSLLLASIYPNPNDGTFWLDIPETFHKGQLEIFDIYGRQILQRDYVNKFPRPAQVKINVASGAYIVRLNSGDRVQSYRILVKQN